MNVIEHVLREELAETRAALRKLAVYCFMRYGHDAYLYNSLADLAGMPIALTKCSHTASGICTHLGCGCHSRLHGRAEISPAPETPDACENCGTVFDDTTMKFITWDDIELCERCHQEIPESQRREEFES